MPLLSFIQRYTITMLIIYSNSFACWTFSWTYFKCTLAFEHFKKVCISKIALSPKICSWSQIACSACSQKYFKNLLPSLKKWLLITWWTASINFLILFSSSTSINLMFWINCILRVHMLLLRNHFWLGFYLDE